MRCGEKNKIAPLPIASHCKGMVVRDKGSRSWEIHFVNALCFMFSTFRFLHVHGLVSTLFRPMIVDTKARSVSLDVSYFATWIEGSGPFLGVPPSDAMSCDWAYRLSHMRETCNRNGRVLGIGCRGAPLQVRPT